MMTIGRALLRKGVRREEEEEWTSGRNETGWSENGGRRFSAKEI